MKRSTLLSLAIGGTLIALCVADDPEPSAEPASQQPVQPGQVSEPVSEPLPVHKGLAPTGNRSAISKKDASISVSTSKKGGATISRNGRMPELRAFSFSSDAFLEQRNSRPIMIRSSRADAKAMEQLTEDLIVMTRLLEKAVAEHSEPPRAANIDIITLGAGMRNSGRSMYVDDYGVIFTLSVNMPLKAEPKVEDVKPKEPTRKGAWEEARGEAFSQRRKVKRWQPSAWRQFDPDEVDAFKATLVDSLREATNIRHLKPNDMIAVVVRGTPQTQEREIKVQTEGTVTAEDVAVDETVESTLVLRIQKMELDRAVAGRDSGELRKNVRVSIY
jgi:hypothetical protein